MNLNYINNNHMYKDMIHQFEIINKSTSTYYCSYCMTIFHNEHACPVCDREEKVELIIK